MDDPGRRADTRSPGQNTNWNADVGPANDAAAHRPAPKKQARGHHGGFWHSSTPGSEPWTV